MFMSLTLSNCDGLFVKIILGIIPRASLLRHTQHTHLRRLMIKSALLYLCSVHVQIRLRQKSFTVYGYIFRATLLKSLLSSSENVFTLKEKNLFPVGTDSFFSE